jgi:hypothetical protein
MPIDVRAQPSVLYRTVVIVDANGDEVDCATIRPVKLHVCRSNTRKPTRWPALLNQTGAYLMLMRDHSLLRLPVISAGRKRKPWERYVN